MNDTNNNSDNASKPRVGFVGAGLMGHGMAKNILAKGWPLTVVAHKNRAPVDDLVAQGADEAPSVADLARAADIIFLCVTASPQVEAIALGPGGVRENARPGTVVVDATTSDPESTRRVNQALRAAGLLFADSPLGRSPAMAEEGKLTSFIAAEAPLFERLRPLLEAYSEIVIHVGEVVGRAHELKLINNFISMGFAAIWSEAYSACVASGNDPKTLHAIVSGGGMNCLNFQNFSKYPVEGNMAAHKFSLANCAKDMDYFIRFSDGLGHGTVVSDGVRQLYKLAIANGHGDNYVAGLLRFVRQMNGGDMPA